MSAARTIQILLLVLNPLVASAAGQSIGTAPPATSAETTPQAQEERASPPPAAKSAPGERAGPAPARATQKQPAAKPAAPRRRSVQQAVGTMPPPAAIQTYGPTLTSPAPSYRPPSGPVPGSVVSQSAPPAPAPAPVQLNSCVGNFCTDAAGSTYNSGTGNAAVNSQGRLCNRVGTTMQCF